MTVFIARTADVDAFWQTIGPRFNAAIEKCGDDISTGELWQICRSGQAFLIIAMDDGGILMGAVVRFERWTNGSILRVLSLVGESIEKWADDVKSFLVEMAKANGATRIVSEGREGWAKIFDEPRKLRSTYIMEL
ncbi:hypothetical protein [Rhizobium rhizogenes]|uniref:hypothetical protein n=1 Tax=Rhizobium rhizogenes TaxID=359 RepID=UPI0022C59580|nr:hypothetical protein [Rhizobium rhizogenes]MCZ7480558.1 hypothetical protein [Rhizobium rhizogenes]